MAPAEVVTASARRRWREVFCSAWGLRVKLPKADRYKTISLKTADLQTARHLAWPGLA